MVEIGLDSGLAAGATHNATLTHRGYKKIDRNLDPYSRKGCKEKQ